MTTTTIPGDCCCGGECCVPCDQYKFTVVGSFTGGPVAIGGCLAACCSCTEDELVIQGGDDGGAGMPMDNVVPGPLVFTYETDNTLQCCEPGPTSAPCQALMTLTCDEGTGKISAVWILNDARYELDDFDCDAPEDDPNILPLALDGTACTTVPTAVRVWCSGPPLIPV